MLHFIKKEVGQTKIKQKLLVYNLHNKDRFVELP